MNRLTAQILIDILRNRMDLDEQQIWIRNQNRKIPGTDGVFVVVGFVNAPAVLGNVTKMIEETQIVDEVEVVVQREVNYVTVLENIQIDIMSRNNDALARQWEVIAAMQSFYAQQQQELNCFKIFRIPRGFIDTSAAEGGSQINRYSINVACMVWYTNDSSMNSPLGDYYDEFKTRVDDEKTIGTDQPLIEFTITEGGIS